MPELLHLNPAVGHVPVDVYNALVDVVNTLSDTVTLYVAHSENLIERMFDAERRLDILLPEREPIDPNGGEPFGQNRAPR